MISQRLAVWLLGLEIAALFAGSYFLAVNREVMGAMSGEFPLFVWLLQGPFALTFWLWAAIFFLVLLAINTVFCSVESLRRKKGGLITMLSPQIIHAGFLLILMAHLMSSLGASKITGQLAQGESARLPGFDIHLNKVEPGQKPYAGIDILSGGNVIRHGVLAPNHPLFFRGYGFYLQEVMTEPFPSAFIEVSREPGAIWALFGGILFTVGTIMLVLLKTRHE
ncbi:MAG: hypothetical protein M0Z61_02295 [Nitrospiraceae bacterium]|nr:hypothetical protein [Nitrospiraceae bacterium]